MELQADNIWKTIADANDGACFDERMFPFSPNNAMVWLYSYDDNVEFAVSCWVFDFENNVNMFNAESWRGVGNTLPKIYRIALDELLETKYGSGGYRDSYYADVYELLFDCNVANEYLSDGKSDVWEAYDNYRSEMKGNGWL